MNKNTEFESIAFDFAVVWKIAENSEVLGTFYGVAAAWLFHIVFRRVAASEKFAPRRVVTKFVGVVARFRWRNQTA